MKPFLSPEDIDRIIAPKEMIELVKLNGVKHTYSDVNGTIVAYSWQDKIWVVEENIIRER